MVELFVLKEEDKQILDVGTDYVNWFDETQTSQKAGVSGDLITDSSITTGQRITKYFEYEKQFQHTILTFSVNKEVTSVDGDWMYIDFRPDIRTSISDSIANVLLNVVNGNYYVVQSPDKIHSINTVDLGGSFEFSIILSEPLNEVTVRIYPRASIDGVSFQVQAKGSLNLNYVNVTGYNTINTNIKADLYKDETIQLTDTIQDVKDIAKVFTPFTQAFKLPASATNNKIFQHYYNADIDGFDARYRIDAIIKIDGADYRKGKIALNKVDLKDGQPISYDVNFFGNTVALTEILGEDELQSLDGTSVLDSYSFSYSASFVSDGLSVGQQNESFIFPLISAKNYYLFDSANSGNYGFELPDGAEVRNLNNDGVLYNDLKPALLVTKVLEAIEEKYSIDFSNDFFSHPDIEKLYLWLHREKGSVEEQLSLVESEDIYLSDFDYSSGDEVRIFNNEYIIISGTPFNNPSATISFTSNTPDSGSYLIELYATVFTSDGVEKTTNALVKEEVNLTGSYNFSFSGTRDYFASLSGVNKNDLGYVGYKIKIKSFSNTQFSLSNIVLSKTQPSQSGNYTYNSGSNNALTGKVSTLAGQFPKMKIIDFLKSLFKMFNLTTYFDGSQLVVKPLDDYYAAGNTYDITKYIDVSNHTVSRSNVYRNVSFEFPESKTFAAYNYNLLEGVEFGNLDFEDRDVDGGKYEVKVDFEKIMYERMSDQADGSQTNFQWGWFCDENKNTYVNKPLLFYAAKSTQDINFDDGSTVSTLTDYFIPSNETFTGSQSIHFGSEFDAFSGVQNTNSLFNNYYSNYINDVFNKKARIYKFTAYLPNHIVNRYELNDTFIIAGREYIINSIKINLLNNKAELELLNKL